jgi:hypothetical protein
MNIDPLAEKAMDWTPFRYGFNNPLIYVDPTGLWEIKVGQREILNKKGKGTGKFENYMFFEAQEGDDINSLSNEIGIELEQWRCKYRWSKCCKWSVSYF